jgi:hypothetical protein
MLHPERIRDKMEEQRPSDQTDWRIEPYGWDSEDREYFLLDDDRLYRRTEAPPAVATWKPKKNTKKAKAAAARAAKRRRVSRAAAADADEDGEEEPASEAEEESVVPEDDGFGGAAWECIAVTLDDVRAFLNSIRKSRDENEKILRDRIEEGLVPILEKQEDSRQRKALAREKELLSLEKMANAKRSSRLAGKAERLKQEEEARKDEEKRRREEAVARKEEQLRIKREKERDDRLMSREKRLKEREARRAVVQEELSQLSEDSKNVSEDGTGRLSERRLQAEIAKNKRALQELDEEEDWIFDCVCGVYGQVDDGTHSIACERCSVWQHSKCVGVSEEDADRDDFNFVCATCKHKEANPKPTVIKLKVKNPGEASSPPPAADEDEAALQQHAPVSQGSEVTVELPSKPVLQPGSSLPHSSAGTDRGQPLTGSHMLHSSPPQARTQPTIPVKPTTQASILPPPSPYANGEASNPFSSPHPTLSPPQQSPNKSRAYSTINQSSPPPARPQTGENKILPPKGIFHVSPRVNGSSQPEKSLSGTLPPDSAFPPVASRIESPVKQPRDNSPTALSSPSTSFSTQGRPPSSGATPSVLTTPQFKHTQPAGSDTKTPTLPPSLPPTQNGISPLKRSPPSARPSSNGSFSTPAPAILPPVRALSPSPSHQISTPPVKPAEPVRPASQQSNGTFGKT